MRKNSETGNIVSPRFCGSSHLRKASQFSDIVKEVFSASALSLMFSISSIYRPKAGYSIGKGRQHYIGSLLDASK